MSEKVVAPAHKCACRGVINKFDTLSVETKQNKTQPTDLDFKEALQQFLEARFEKATAILEDKFNANPQDVATGFVLAQGYRLQHRYQDMINIYETLALTHHLSHLMTFELAVGYLNLGSMDKALPLLERVAGQGHYEEAIAYHLAEAYFRAGKLMSAITTLREAIPRSPDSRRLKDFLARLHEVSDP